MKTRSSEIRFGGLAVRLRRRECRHCGCRFTTREGILGGSIADKTPGTKNES